MLLISSCIVHSRTIPQKGQLDSVCTAVITFPPGIDNDRIDKYRLLNQLTKRTRSTVKYRGKSIDYRDILASRQDYRSKEGASCR